MQYLDRIDPAAASRARARYRCFDHFQQDIQAYGYAAAAGIAESCEGEAVAELLELRRAAADYANRDGRVAHDAFFFAEQNARLVKNAEEYYRSMFRGRIASWNMRDLHMVETLEALVDHLQRWTSPVKVVVWAHNSHLGNARATEMGQHGELNVGQVVRDRHGRHARHDARRHRDGRDRMGRRCRAEDGSAVAPLERRVRVPRFGPRSATRVSNGLSA